MRTRQEVDHILWLLPLPLSYGTASQNLHTQMHSKTPFALLRRDLANDVAI